MSARAVYRRSRFKGLAVEIADADIDERQLYRTEAIILSMTPKERRKPELINFSRKKRIAAGSGTSLEDINKLLRQFEQMKKMMKMNLE